MIDIIPAIDIIGGKCVRLTKGDYDRMKVYSSDPADVAKAYEDCGCRYLHVVDLDGAKSGGIVNHRTLEHIVAATSLTVDFGGGIKREEDVRKAFDFGAAKITLGSIAVKDTELASSWLEKYGPQRIIIGADTRDGMISTSGWLHDSDREILEFLGEYIAKGACQVISTDINVDGTLSGPSIELYGRIMSRFPGLFLIASGGVGSMQDVETLAESGIPAVIVGKAIYEGHITLKQLEKFNSQ